ncbi:MAG: hypothetical protein KDK24_00900 [Pseudooceanicola sp.]|nr:hypothetical protein [Pseudooceanicola sp.]
MPRLTIALLALIPALPLAAQAASGALATDETASSPAFDALKAALETGTPGTPESSAIGRGEGCVVSYEIETVYRGAPIKGWVRLDLAKVNLDKAKVTVFDGGTNLELRAESGAENVWEGELTGPAEHAAVMTKMGATCDATICRSVIDEPQPTLSLIGADQQARAEAAITAMQDYRTECME